MVPIKLPDVMRVNKSQEESKMNAFGASISRGILGFSRFSTARTTRPIVLGSLLFFTKWTTKPIALKKKNEVVGEGWIYTHVLQLSQQHEGEMGVGGRRVTKGSNIEDIIFTEEL